MLQSFENILRRRRIRKIPNEEGGTGFAITPDHTRRRRTTFGLSATLEVKPDCSALNLHWTRFMLLDSLNNILVRDELYVGVPHAFVTIALAFKEQVSMRQSCTESNMRVYLMTYLV